MRSSRVSENFLRAVGARPVDPVVFSFLVIVAVRPLLSYLLAYMFHIFEACVCNLLRSFIERRLGDLWQENTRIALPVSIEQHRGCQLVLAVVVKAISSISAIKFATLGFGCSCHILCWGSTCQNKCYCESLVHVIILFRLNDFYFRN